MRGIAWCFLHHLIINHLLFTIEIPVFVIFCCTNKQDHIFYERSFILSTLHTNTMCRSRDKDVQTYAKCDFKIESYEH